MTADGAKCQRTMPPAATDGYPARLPTRRQNPRQVLPLRPGKQRNGPKLAARLIEPLGQLHGVLACTDHGQAEVAERIRLSAKIMMIWKGQHLFRGTAQKGYRRVQRLRRIAYAAQKGIGPFHGRSACKGGVRSRVLPHRAQARRLHAEGEHRPGKRPEALPERRHKFRPLRNFHLDEEGPRVVQRRYRFAPAPGGNDSVPVGGRTPRRRTEAHVVLVEKHKVEVPPGGNMLETVIQQKKIRRTFLFQNSPRTTAVGIHHDHGLGVPHGQHERLIPAFRSRHARFHTQGQAGRMRAVTTGEHGCTQAFFPGMGKQPVRHRSLARAAPGNIAYGHAGARRLPHSFAAPRAGTPAAAAETVEHGKGQKKRSKHILEGMTFRHDSTGRSMNGDRGIPCRKFRRRLFSKTPCSVRRQKTENYARPPSGR